MVFTLNESARFDAVRRSARLSDRLHGEKYFLRGICFGFDRLDCTYCKEDVERLEPLDFMWTYGKADNTTYDEVYIRL